MKSFRLTLISDPTDEHPQNQNNNFKVRLPTRLNLEGNTWQASLWSVSVPDVGHSSAAIHSNSNTNILNYRYTLTKRYARVGVWSIEFAPKDKKVTLKNVMGSSYPVYSGHQLWQNIISHMEQTMMEDVEATFDTWKKEKGNTAAVSLKATWKPTFEWVKNTLVLKHVLLEDALVHDLQLNVQPLSTVGIHVDFAETFGLLIKDQKNQYQLGPNLDFVLPTTTYTSDTSPVGSNDRFQWLGLLVESDTM